jgi:hypothetical protein
VSGHYRVREITVVIPYHLLANGPPRPGGNQAPVAEQRCRSRLDIAAGCPGTTTLEPCGMLLLATPSRPRPAGYRRIWRSHSRIAGIAARRSCTYSRGGAWCLLRGLTPFSRPIGCPPRRSFRFVELAKPASGANQPLEERRVLGENRAPATGPTGGCITGSSTPKRGA